MRRVLILLTAAVLAGCLGGNVTEQQAMEAVRQTDSYQQLNGNVTTTAWKVNQSSFRQAANISGVPTQRQARLYGLQTFSDFPTDPGFIVRATGDDAGYYYHVGQDGKVSATVSMDALQKEITSKMQQTLADMQQNIQQMQQCSITRLSIEMARYSNDDSLLTVSVLNTGQRTVPTIRAEALNDGAAVKSTTAQELAAGEYSTFRLTVERQPDTVRIVPTGCPDFAVTQSLR